MGDNTISNLRGKGSSATYWRRRFFALLISLSVFGVLAWAVSGAIGQPRPIRAAGNVTHGTGAGSGAGGPAGGGSGSGSGASGGTAAVSPSPSATASPAPSSQATGGTGGTGATGQAGTGTGTGTPGNGKSNGRQGGQGGGHKGKRHPAPAPSGQAPGSSGPRAPRCETRHIVLSLVVGKPSYPAHANPQFTINVVSTAKQTCIFDVGAAHLALVIRTVAGQVWSSADCAQGRKSLMSDLAPGVPTAIPVSWNRTASRPGCKSDPGRAGSGLYAATAESASLTSKEAIFRIR